MSAEVGSDRDHPTRASRRVARNAMYLAVAEGTNKVMLFVFNLVAARHLGVAKFGILSFAVAFVTMLAVFTDLGLGALSAREIARDSAAARRLMSSSLSLKLVSSLVVIFLIYLLVNLMGYPRATVRIVYICSLLVIESALTAYYCWVFQGYERMGLSALTRVSQTVVLVVGALLLSRHGGAVENYALLYVVAGLFSVLFAVAVASVWLVRPSLSFRLVSWWEVLRPSLPIGMTVMFTMLYYWNGTTLLSKLRGNEAVGNYSAAFRLAMGLAFAGLAFSGAVFPLLSRLFTTNRQRFTQTLELALRYMLLLVLPIAVFCSALASPIITIVYGPEYSEAAGVFGIVAWWGSLACLNSLLSNYFLAVNRPAVVTVQTGVSLGICVVGNILLIPSLGAQGSAYAIVVAEAIGVLCLSTVMLVGPDGLKLHRYSLAIVRTVVALVPASVALRAAIRWNMPAGIAVGAAAYLLVLVFVQGIERRDVTFLRALVSRNDA